MVDFPASYVSLSEGGMCVFLFTQMFRQSSADATHRVTLCHFAGQDAH